MARRRKGRALRRRYGRSGAPDPTGGWAVVQRMMAVYAAHLGLEYSHNSAIPAGGGRWSFYARPRGGGKATRHEVSQEALRAAYARGGLS